MHLFFEHGSAWLFLHHNELTAGYVAIYLRCAKELVAANSTILH